MQRSRGSHAQGFLWASRSASAASACSAGACVPTTKRLRRSALLAAQSRGPFAAEGAAALSRPYLSCMVSAHRPALQMSPDCSTCKLLRPPALSRCGSLQAWGDVTAWCLGAQVQHEGLNMADQLIQASHCGSWGRGPGQVFCIILWCVAFGVVLHYKTFEHFVWQQPRAVVPHAEQQVRQLKGGPTFGQSHGRRGGLPQAVPRHHHVTGPGQLVLWGDVLRGAVGWVLPAQVLCPSPPARCLYCTNLGVGRVRSQACMLRTWLSPCRG